MGKFKKKIKKQVSMTPLGKKIMVKPGVHSPGGQNIEKRRWKKTKPHKKAEASTKSHSKEKFL